jgi:hypothetical protein
MRRKSLVILAIATFALTFVFAYAAGAQETTTESEDGAAAETQSADEADPKDDVIKGTVPDKLLPNTGGMPLLGLVVSGLTLVGAGISVIGSTIRRNT